MIMEGRIRTSSIGSLCFGMDSFPIARVLSRCWHSQCPGFMSVPTLFGHLLDSDTLGTDKKSVVGVDENACRERVGRCGW